LMLFSMIVSTTPAFAAIPVDLSKPNILAFRALAPTLEAYQQSTDFNHTTHIHMKQMYHGYPVWGANGIKHLPSKNTSGNRIVGHAYLALDADLRDTPNDVFNPTQARNAISTATQLAANEYTQTIPTQKSEASLMIYVDQNNKAHWVFYISLSLPHAKPVYILDAQSLHVYQSWNEFKTSALENVNGGGIGGNIKMGKLIYDSLVGDLISFPIKRDAILKLCYLQNDIATVKDSRTHLNITFACANTDAEHNNVYWSNVNDMANDGYSPDVDAIYGITFIQKMYQDWYGFAAISENNKPAPVTVYTHVDMDNASWEGKVNGEWRIELGDGGDIKYPSTAIGVIAHEIAHGFTQQHSGLVYAEESGGLNESFSDMADQAAQYYAYGKNNWMHDAEITKAEGRALRYLDQPSKDCYDLKQPGKSCSIDKMSQYYKGLNVHYSSGIFNHVFYLIGTANGWNAKKTFDVMLKANSDYWIPNTTFAEAACGVISATKDYQYDLTAVLHAFEEVGVDTQNCATS
jgi:pseudolysin